MGISFSSASPPSSDGIVLSNPTLLPSPPLPTDHNQAHYPLHKQATLHLPLTYSTLSIAARGSSSAGEIHVVELDGEGDSVRVDVRVGYTDERELEALNVCLLGKGEEGRGVGVYTPHKIHIPRPPLYITLTVHLPPLRLPTTSLSCVTSNTSCTLALPSAKLASIHLTTSNGSILSSTPLETLSTLTLHTSNAPIDGSFTTPQLNLKTSNKPIRGGHWQAQSINVRTSNSPISFDDISFSDQADKLELVTSNGAVEGRIDLPDRPIGAKVESSNGPITLAFQSSAAPIAHRAQVRTSNAGVKITHRGSFAGRVEGRTSGAEGVVLTGLEGKENVIVKKEAGRSWAEVGMDGKARLEVESSNAPVHILFDL